MVTRRTRLQKLERFFESAPHGENARQLNGCVQQKRLSHGFAAQRQRRRQSAFGLIEIMSRHCLKSCGNITRRRFGCVFQMFVKFAQRFGTASQLEKYLQHLLALCF